MKNIVVLQSVRRPDKSTNPYITTLTSRMSKQVDVVYFSWANALLRNYSIFHVHWPEQIFRSKSRKVKIIKGIFAWAFLLRLACSSVSVVWTVHNAKPHESGGCAERLFLRLFDRLVAHRIYLTSATENFDKSSCTVIPHGHYREWFSHHPLKPRYESRYLFCGLIRPYKGVESLVNAFKEIPDSNSRLMIAGLPYTADFGRGIAARAVSDPRISMRMSYLSDRELVAEVTASSVIVLPYLQMGNSGVLLMALSLDRPVLLPASKAASEMRRLVGEDWILTYDGELKGRDLEDAKQRVEQMSGCRPDLSHFEWDPIIEAHVNLYRRLANDSQR